MNVYLKLQIVRNELRKLNLKKTGKNKHMGFGYYELGDFLPAITELCEKHKLCSMILFEENIAKLLVIDAEKPDAIIEFTTQVKEAQLQGKPQPIQNLGATQTYLRRYLYMNAFEIVESDMVDLQNNKPTSQTTNSKKLISQDQVTRLYTIAKGQNAKAKEVLAKYKYTSSKDVETKDYDKICKKIEEAVKESV